MAFLTGHMAAPDNTGKWIRMGNRQSPDRVLLKTIRLSVLSADLGTIPRPLCDQGLFCEITTDSHRQCQGRVETGSLASRSLNSWEEGIQRAETIV